MLNTGTEYEEFVQNLVRALLQADKVLGQKNILVERRKIIKDRNGIDREIDVYWEFELAGIVYKTAIECKDYKSRVSIEKIDALIGKIQDIPGMRGVFATTKGYQKGAQSKAKQHNIELLVVREIKDTDFVDKNGNPLISKISIDITALPSPSILNLEVGLDQQYIEEQHILSYPKGRVCVNVSSMYIERENTKESLATLLANFFKKQTRNPGTYTDTIPFTNAFIVYQDGVKLKIKQIVVSYCIPKPIHTTTDIDFKNIYAGVVEYLNNGKKTWIRKNGIIEER